METLSPEIWTAVRLTIELAATATAILLLIGTPIAWWLARSQAWWEEVIATIVALPLVLPPTVLGCYLLVLLGPDGPGGRIAGLWGARTLAFTFPGLVIGSGVFLVPSHCVAPGERRRLRIAARDVSITSSPVVSTILNVMPARIVSVSPAGDFELVVVLGLGSDGAGAKLLARVTRQSWQRLALAVDADVNVQVKAIALT